MAESGDTSSAPEIPANWTAADLQPQNGRTIMVTGASSGIGLETARELARAGAHVVLAVRDTDRGQAAADTMPGAVEVQRVDLADLSSVRALAGRWSARKLDVLINNAAVFAVPKGRTADGFETQMGTNYLGPFALTNLLLPQLQDRVVFVGSTGHRGPQVDIDDLAGKRRRYRRVGAYQQSKLAVLLHTLELQHLLSDAGSTVRVLTAHPGWVSTRLHSHTGNRALGALFTAGVRLRSQSCARGAWPSLVAATEDLPSGTYLGPDGRGERTGHPGLAGRSAESRDRSIATRLWKRSAELTGTEFPRQ